MIPVKLKYKIRINKAAEQLVIKEDVSFFKKAANNLFRHEIGGSTKEGKYPWSPYRAIAPASNWLIHVWNWDSAFHMMGIIRFDRRMASEQAYAVFSTQRADGMLCDAMRRTGEVIFEVTKPPVFGMAIKHCSKISEDMELIEEIYPKLIKNIEWWSKDRYDGILYNYDGNPADSGWDDTVRYDDCKNMKNIYAIDLNCYMVSSFDGLAYMADKLSKSDEAAEWRRKKTELIDKIQKILWDYEKNRYCDFDKSINAFTNRISPASFMPLFYMIATNEQAEHMKKLAEDTAYFYPFIPTIAYNDRAYNPVGYWRGRDWINTAYFVIKGIYNYGYSDLALDLINIQVNNMKKQGINEGYNGTTGKAVGWKHYGWTCTFAMEMMILKKQILTKEKKDITIN